MMISCAHCSVSSRLITINLTSFSMWSSSSLSIRNAQSLQKIGKIEDLILFIGPCIRVGLSL